MSFVPPFKPRPDVDVTTAVIALTTAMERVEKAAHAQATATQDHYDAVANCNKIQMDFDALVNHLRMTAPKGTAWETQYGPD